MPMTLRVQVPAQAFQRQQRVLRPRVAAVSTHTGKPFMPDAGKRPIARSLRSPSSGTILRVAECFQTWSSWPGMHANEPARENDAQGEARGFRSTRPNSRNDFKLWGKELKSTEERSSVPWVVDRTTRAVEPPDVIADTLITFANVSGRDAVIASSATRQLW
jgi:hypothetical protein